MTGVSPSATILDIFRDAAALESVLELEIVVLGRATGAALAGKRNKVGLGLPAAVVGLCGTP